MDGWKYVLVILTMTTMISSISLFSVLSDMKYSKSVKKAVDLYNRGTNTAFLFKLQEDRHEYKWNGSSGLRQTKFTMKETVCRKSEMAENCEFIPDGMAKNCTVYINKQGIIFSIICNSVTPLENKKSINIDEEAGKFTQDSSNDFYKKGDYIHKREEDNGHTKQVFQSIKKEVYKMDQELKGKLIKRDTNTQLGINVIILDDGIEFILQDIDDADVQVDNTIFIETNNQSQTTSPKEMHRAHFIGRMLCLECVFDIFANS